VNSAILDIVRKFRQWLPVPSQFRRLLRPKQVAIYEACLIGLISGLAAVLLKQSVEWLGDWRLEISSQAIPDWLVLPIVGLVGGVLSGWLVERFAPEAGGSGIPQVKAALGYVPIPLDARVAFVKLISTTLSLGSGLALGRQGPTVQIGAAIASQLSHWLPTSPEYRRQLLAAGAAAGLAAAFNAPIAGVLFVVEELLQDVSGLTLGTAILASFVGAVISRWLGGRTLNTYLSASGYGISFSVQEIPLFMLLGALAGLFGALFCRGLFLSLRFNRQVLKVGLPWRIGLAGMVSGLILGLLPVNLHDNTSGHGFGISDMGWRVTAVIFVAKFILTLISFGSGAPGGLFAPSLILGSALGYLVSYGAQGLQGVSSSQFGTEAILISPTTYALAGMGAFFSAVTRGPITAIVIVFEMTMDFNLVLPLMIGSVVAYLVAETLFRGSIYKRILEWNGIQIEPQAPADKRLAGLTASDIMQRRVETLASSMSLDEAAQAFSRSHHRGFPVVDDGKLVGIVTQTDLTQIAARHLSGAMPLSEIMTPQPVAVSPEDSLSQVLYLLNRYKISRLPVTEGRKLIGIITRADIIRAESDQLGGDVSQAGPQPEPSYGIYQTRAPALGRGRLLVPLANPQTADALLQMAAAIARDRHYELECLQVIILPRNQSPAETSVRTTKSRRLLRQAEALGRQWQIPVHTQIRLAHDVAQAILETIKERHIDIVLMGWKGNTTTPGRIFGSAMDTIIRQASCEVILVKLGDEEQPTSPLTVNREPLTPSLHFDRWLVPIAGGPNAQEAVKLLPGLTALSEYPEIWLCQVFQPSKPEADKTLLQQDVNFLNRHLSTPAIAIPIYAEAVEETIVNLAERKHCDVIILGASREGMLQQAIKGNLPEAIARNSRCTVILVRGAIS
jgi:chloride channel protein, CIC family